MTPLTHRHVTEGEETWGKGNRKGKLKDGEEEKQQGTERKSSKHSEESSFDSASGLSVIGWVEPTAMAATPHHRHYHEQV